MRIAWVSHTGEVTGGAEISLVEAAAALAERGVELHAVLPWRGPLADRLEALDVPVSVLAYRWWVQPDGASSLQERARRSLSLGKRWQQNVIAAAGVSGVLTRVRPDAVVTNTITVPVGAVAARRAGVPHVWYVHEFGGKPHGLRFDLGERASLSLVNRLSERVIVNSHAVRTRFEGTSIADKIRVVYYAVEVPVAVRPRERPPAALTLVSLGWLRASKGQEDGVRALGVLASRGLDVRLRLVGAEDAEYGAFLRRLARELGVADRVDFVPFHEDALAELAGADLALVCSRTEAFGRTTVEAMKLGKAVVGANAGGTAELIRDRWNGLLYQPGNADELAHKIETAYRDRALLAEMAGHAAEWSRRTFSRARYGEALLEVLEDAAATPRGRAVVVS